jgi:hypothetical protein
MLLIPKFLFRDTTVSSTMRFGTTAARGYKGSSSTNPTKLNEQASILLIYNNKLYIGNCSNQFFVFELDNRTDRALRSFGSYPSSLFYDNRIYTFM